ncbi:MAG: zinc-ribbon domain-containing protein [Sandaracinaceae bacterium]|nr:zinc-ribbon domain-containing protein [Sandaracinaceae bacterium]
MKITCESCGAKYSIADAKIAGRSVKIRCKKCGASMLVRASTPAAMNEGPQEEWHVHSDGAPIGPLTAEALRAGVSQGAIARDALVWREGMDDWAALERVAELGLSDSGCEPGGEPQRDEPSDPSAPSQRAPDLQAADPQAADPLTGARNESSVLFSLANLQALSTPKKAAPRAAEGSSKGPARAEVRSEPASGLIDIRALAGALEPRAPAGPVRADEVLAIGGPSLSVLGAPVIVPSAPERRSWAPVVAGLAVAAIAVLGASAFVLTWSSRPQVTAEPSTPEPEPRPAARAPAPLERAPSQVQVTPGTLERESPPPISNSQEAGLQQARVQEGAPEAPPRPAPIATAPRPRPRPIEARPVVEARPPVREPRPERDPVGELFEERPRPTPQPVVAQGPSTPSRGDIQSAMNSVMSAVRACGASGHGSAVVSVSFRGENGSVGDAQVSSTDLSPASQSCVARAVRGARVPAFRQASFRVTYPFRI